MAFQSLLTIKKGTNPFNLQMNDPFSKFLMETTTQRLDPNTTPIIFLVANNIFLGETVVRRYVLIFPVVCRRLMPMSLIKKEF